MNDVSISRYARSIGKIERYINKRNRVLLSIIIVSFVVLTVIEIIIMPPNTSISVFYLIPVAITTWIFGVREGITLSLLSAVATFIAHIMHAEVEHRPFSHYWQASTEGINLITVTFILAVLKISLKHEQTISRTDYITGTANGRYFYELAEAELSRLQRFKKPLTAAYMDIDNFKKINDTAGHDAGDGLLRVVGQTIKKHVRTIDIVARLGGDEFGIVLPGAGFEEANEVVGRLRVMLHDAVRKKYSGVTFSIGAVTFVDPPGSINEMVKATDRLMYSVKSTGKNNVRHEIYRPVVKEKEVFVSKR